MEPWNKPISIIDKYWVANSSHWGFELSTLKCHVCGMWYSSEGYSVRRVIYMGLSVELDNKIYCLPHAKCRELFLLNPLAYTECQN